MLYDSQEVFSGHGFSSGTIVHEASKAARAVLSHPGRSVHACRLIGCGLTPFPCSADSRSCSGCSEPVEPAGGTLLSGCVRLLNADSRLVEERSDHRDEVRRKKGKRRLYPGGDRGHSSHRGAQVCLRRVVTLRAPQR